MTIYLNIRRFTSNTCRQARPVDWVRELEPMLVVVERDEDSGISNRSSRDFTTAPECLQRFRRLDIFSDSQVCCLTVGRIEFHCDRLLVRKRNLLMMVTIAELFDLMGITRAMSYDLDVRIVRQQCRINRAPKIKLWDEHARGWGVFEMKSDISRFRCRRQDPCWKIESGNQIRASVPALLVFDNFNLCLSVNDGFFDMPETQLNRRVDAVIELQLFGIRFTLQRWSRDFVRAHILEGLELFPRNRQNDAYDGRDGLPTMKHIEGTANTFQVG